MAAETPETLTHDERRRLADLLLAEDNPRELAQRFGSSPESLMRAALGLGVRHGSIALIRDGLARGNS